MTGADGPPDYLHPATLGLTLVRATAQALRGLDCANLTDPGRTAWTDERSTVEALGRAVPPHRLDEVDPDEVADWVVRQYPDGPYAGVVVGSPHGSAAHLAVAMGVPWLPVSFAVDVVWPDAGAIRVDAVWRRGAEVASRLRRCPGVAVRQLYEPLRTGRVAARRTTHQLSWRRLPSSYRAFLAHRVRPGAAVVLVADVRQWPRVAQGVNRSLQIGSPTAGLTPRGYLNALAMTRPLESAAVRAWLTGGLGEPAPAEHAVDAGFGQDLRGLANRLGRVLHTITYRCPSRLAAAVADLQRGWLRAAGKTGDRLVVECGRLLDPYHVGRSGLVPYWCESPTVDSVQSAELWLASSEPFTAVEALPEPAGVDSPWIAPLDQWQRLVGFAGHRGVVDRLIARAYPGQLLSTRDATAVLRNHPNDLPRPRSLTVPELVPRLRGLAMNEHIAHRVGLDVAMP